MEGGWVGEVGDKPGDKPEVVILIGSRLQCAEWIRDNVEPTFVLTGATTRFLHTPTDTSYLMVDPACLAIELPKLRGIEAHHWRFADPMIQDAVEFAMSRVRPRREVA